MNDRIKMRRKRNISMGCLYTDDDIKNFAENSRFSSSMYWKTDLELDIFYRDFFVYIAEELDKKWWGKFVRLEKEKNVFQVLSVKCDELHKNILMELNTDTSPNLQKIIFTPSDDMNLLACIEGFHQKVSNIGNVEFIL